MTGGSRLWWTAAFAASACGLIFPLLVPEGPDYFFTFGRTRCPAIGFRSDLLEPAWPFLLPLLFGGGLGVVLCLLSWWLARRRGEGRWGRATARVVAAAMLAVNGFVVLSAAVDALRSSSLCLRYLGGGLPAFGSSAAAVLAACCVLLAVRRSPRARESRQNAR